MFTSIKKISISILLCFLLFPTNIAIASEEKIKDVLLSSGFENILIEKNNNKYTISYENRTFIHELSALSYILKNLKNLINKESILDIYIQSSGQAILNIKLTYSDYLDFIDEKIDEKTFYNKISLNTNPNLNANSKIENNSFLHTDISLSPSYLIDGTKGPYINLSPAINTFFNNGFDLYLRGVTPVYSLENNFDFAKNFDFIKPQLRNAHITYFNSIKNTNIYTAFRLGEKSNLFNYSLFLSNDTSMNIFDGLLSLNLATGVIYHLNDKSTTFSIIPSLNFYYGDWDILAEIGGGKYLGNSYGIFTKLVRQFDFADLGFSVTKTFGEYNGSMLAFDFKIYLGPEKTNNAAPLRFTLSKPFSGNLFTGNSVALLNPSTDLRDYIKRLYPEYIRTHLYYLKQSN